MTRDGAFLKSARIVQEEICAANWMEWRTDELEAMRILCDALRHTADEERRERKRMVLIAWYGWGFAALLFSIPIIERWTG